MKQKLFICLVGVAISCQILVQWKVIRAQSLAGIELPLKVPTTTLKIIKPDQPRVRCQTTKGDFEVQLRPDLAPHGAKRIQEMIEVGFFNQGIAFFRVNEWLTQFGADQHDRVDDPFAGIRKPSTKDVHPDLKRNATKLSSWERGTLAYIGGTQMVIVIHPNPNMGTKPHDAPAGFITKGMDTVFDRLHQYNDPINNPKGGAGPDQTQIFKQGLTYIHQEFPKTDIIKSCDFF